MIIDAVLVCDFYINIFLFVRFEVFMSVTMKNVVFWDITPCGCYKNRRFGGTHHLHYQVIRIGELGTILSSETSVIQQLNIPEDGIVHFPI
jgi:hypothetical protein